MKSLLIPTDLSEKARPAIFYGIEIAKKLDLQVFITYVADVYGYVLNYGYGISVPPTTYTKANSEIREQAETAFQELLSEVDEKYSQRPPVHLITKKGDTSYVIEELVERHDVDMVIIPGRADREFFSQFIADKNYLTAKNTPCPVWIIPPEYEFKSLNKIVYATDYNEEDIATLKSLVHLAKPYNAEIVILHITDSDDFNRKIKQSGFHEMVREKVDYPAIEHVHKRGSDVVDDVNEFAIQSKADLIVMLKENDNFLQQIFSRSNTKKMIWHSKLPLLIYKEEAFKK